MERNYNTLDSLHMEITDKEIVTISRNFCKNTNIKYKELGTMALKQFFKDKKNQLMALSKEQLVNIICQWSAEDGKDVMAYVRNHKA